MGSLSETGSERNRPEKSNVLRSFRMEDGLPTRQGFVFVKGKEMEFDIPTGWEIICQSAPRTTPASGHPIGGLVHRSLENPIGSGTIAELANPDCKVAILVDDDTRPTPVKEILPLVLQELHDCSVPRENVDIIIAVGTHPPLIGKQLEKRLGELTGCMTS